MKVGVVVPQGFLREFAGWPPERAWARIVAVARAAETAGADTVWVFDHLGTFGALRDDPTFEAFAVLGGLAASTSRVRIGTLVARVGLRNPGLLAKHAATLDVISGGRLELGLGAGSVESEANAFGYSFDPFRDRIELLRETLQLLRPLFEAGRATFRGTKARAEDAILNPRGAQQPRIPLLVGGNSTAAQQVAVALADEVNLDGATPEATRDAVAKIAGLCEAAGRDPASLATSVYLFPKAIARGGAARVDLLAAYASLGIRRVMALVPGAADSDDAIVSFFDDARAAGAELGASGPPA